MQKTNVQVGIGPAFLLFCIFLVLKLCKVVTWSWLWVFAPLWIPFAIFAGFLIVVLVLAGIAKLL